jgi:transposase
MRKEPVMRKRTRYLGIDVHADSLVAAIAEAGRKGEVRALGAVPNSPAAVRRLVAKVGGPEGLRACYEAGPCGYALYWELTRLGVECEVVAPTLIPVKAGDRVKTDRRDAEKLARCYRSGDLTAVWVPDEAHEALRDLVRAREAAKKDQLRARHRLSKLLLRHGKRSRETKAWGTKYMEWVRSLRFEQRALQLTLVDYLAEVEHAAARIERLEKAIAEAVETAPAAFREVVAALQTLRGVAFLTATTATLEVGAYARFESPRQLMAYAGIVPSEHSTGGPGNARRGGITKAGNAHLRRVLIEAAWTYRHRPGVGNKLRPRLKEQPEAVTEIAWKAQHRLHSRYVRLASRGKPGQVVVTAVARELLGFMWAIAAPIERRTYGVLEDKKAA